MPIEKGNLTACERYRKICARYARGLISFLENGKN
jgi:hypothetical protein